MIRLLICQFIMLVVAAVVAICFFGIYTLPSAALGGLSYLLPSLLSVIILILIRRQAMLLPAALLMIEISKIFLVCLILLVIYATYKAVHWPMFMLGLILVSQAGLLTYTRKRRT